MKPKYSGALPAILSAAILSGCSGSSNGGPVLPAPNPTQAATPPASPTAAPAATPTATPEPRASLNLTPFADPWTRAQPRWRDIDNNLFAASFRSGPDAFRYARSLVTLTYERAPGVPTFRAHITARGLKPNFAYQLKLAGKPIYGSRGFGVTGSFVNVDSRLPSARPILNQRLGANRQPLAVNADDWTNQQLGFAGRWWDDTLPPGTNLDDAYYRANYPRHTIYGYIFLGDFVTDEFGRANVDIEASRSYHITWQDKQNGIEDAPAGTFVVRAANPPFYGYNSFVQSRLVKLWYQYEPSRPHQVQLKPGTYHCRLLVTEEAFHTSGGEYGGVWQTVLASEEAGDSNPDNDIAFTIR